MGSMEGAQIEDNEILLTVNMCSSWNALCFLFFYSLKNRRTIMHNKFSDLIETIWVLKKL